MIRIERLGGREFTVLWELVDTDATDTTNIDNFLQQVNLEVITTLIIPGNTFLPGFYYHFRATVTNYVGIKSRDEEESNFTLNIIDSNEGLSLRKLFS